MKIWMIQGRRWIVIAMFFTFMMMNVIAPSVLGQSYKVTPDEVYFQCTPDSKGVLTCVFPSKQLLEATEDKILKVDNNLNIKANVFGTDYLPNTPATSFLQLLNDSQSINNASCMITIYNTDKTKFIDNEMMTYVNDSNGIYYYDFTSPSVSGVHIVDASCMYTTESGQDEFSDSFGLINGLEESGTFLDTYTANVIEHRIKENVDNFYILDYNFTNVNVTGEEEDIVIIQVTTTARIEKSDSNMSIFDYNNSKYVDFASLVITGSYDTHSHTITTNTSNYIEDGKMSIRFSNDVQTDKAKLYLDLLKIDLITGIENPVNLIRGGAEVNILNITDLQSMTSLIEGVNGNLVILNDTIQTNDNTNTQSILTEIISQGSQILGNLTSTSSAYYTALVSVIENNFGVGLYNSTGGTATVNEDSIVFKVIGNITDEHGQGLYNSTLTSSNITDESIDNIWLNKNESLTLSPVSSTEYEIGETVKIQFQVTSFKGSDETPINDANCEVNITTPDNAEFLNTTMFNINNQGVYETIFTGQTPYGIWTANVHCFDGITDAYESRTFHMNPQTNNLNNSINSRFDFIDSTLSSIISSIDSLNTLVSQIPDLVWNSTVRETNSSFTVEITNTTQQFIENNTIIFNNTVNITNTTQQFIDNITAIFNNTVEITNTTQQFIDNVTIINNNTVEITNTTQQFIENNTIIFNNTVNITNTTQQFIDNITAIFNNTVEITNTTQQFIDNFTIINNNTVEITNNTVVQNFSFIDNFTIDQSPIWENFTILRDGQDTIRSEAINNTAFLNSRIDALISQIDSLTTLVNQIPTLVWNNTIRTLTSFGFNVDLTQSSIDAITSQTSQNLSDVHGDGSWVGLSDNVTIVVNTTVQNNTDILDAIDQTNTSLTGTILNSTDFNPRDILRERIFIGELKKENIIKQNN